MRKTATVLSNEMAFINVEIQKANEEFQREKNRPIISSRSGSCY